MSFFIVLLMSCGPKRINFYIFDNIHECEGFQHLKYKGGKFTQYENPKSDKYLKELTYNDFFAADYKSDEVKFEIYAYVFDSKETSQQYFRNSTGKNDDQEINFLASAGLTSCKITVIDCEKAYTIVGPSYQFETIKKIIGEVFTVKL